MTTVGEAISRIRATLKAVKEDAFLTDRNIYFSILKYGKTLLKREDNQYRLMKMSSLFTYLPYLELIDVDKVEAGCIGVYSECYIKRTKEKLPQLFDGMFGPILRTVSSIDGSIRMYRTEPATFVSITKSTNYKFNKKVYFWYLNGYLYIPNVDWDAIKVEGIFEGDKSDFLCPTETNQCMIRQDFQLPFPEYLFSEIESFVVKDLSMSMSIPPDGPDDSQNVLR
jgi:hypothetical protein